MTEAQSVLEKATSLQGEIRRLDASAQEDAQARRVTERIRELRDALDKLKRQIDIARAIMRQAQAAEISLDGLDNGRASLSSRGSLPSDQAFLAARRKVEETTAGISQKVRQAWDNWTAGQLESLPRIRISRLTLDDRSEARSAYEELTRMAPSSSLGPSLFADKRERLRKLLEQAPVTPEQVAEVLDRLPCTLSELTDADIALLREHGLDHDIEVRRKDE